MNDLLLIAAGMLAGRWGVPLLVWLLTAPPTRHRPSLDELLRDYHPSDAVLPPRQREAERETVGVGRR